MDNPKREIAQTEIENAEQGGNFEKPLNGLAQHQEVSLTFEEIKAEKLFVLKIDLLILPLLTIMFFLASLDRGDLANAYTAGLSKELHMTPSQLSTNVSLFYVGYIIFELPATLLLKKLTASIQLSAALLSWGTFTALLCVCKSSQDIGGIRILIGSAEAFIQVASLYLTFFYKRDQLATRGGIYYAMIAIAGSSNGLLTYAILKNLNGVRGWLAWRWIFFIEGMMSVGFGFFIFVLLPSSPETLRWPFSAAEKKIAIRRYHEAFNIEDTQTIRVTQIWQVLKDPKAWFYTVIYSCVNISLSAFSNFLPVMIKGYGYSSIDSNLLTIPVWVCAAIFILLFCILSDRLKKRGVLLLICFFIAAVGWIILLVSKSKWVEFFGTMVIGSGTLPQVVILQSWMNNNMVGYTKRATALAMIIMVGQSMGIASAKIYSDAPLYYRGNGFALGGMVVGFIVTAILMVFLTKKNAMKTANQDSPGASAMRVMNIEEIQDDHPDFYYYI